MKPLEDLIEFMRNNDLLSLTTERIISDYLVSVEIRPLENEEEEVNE